MGSERENLVLATFWIFFDNVTMYLGSGNNVDILYAYIYLQKSFIKVPPTLSSAAYVGTNWNSKGGFFKLD